MKSKKLSEKQLRRAAHFWRFGDGTFEIARKCMAEESAVWNEIERVKRMAKQAGENQ